MFFQAAEASFCFWSVGHVLSTLKRSNNSVVILVTYNSFVRWTQYLTRAALWSTFHHALLSQLNFVPTFFSWNAPKSHALQFLPRTPTLISDHFCLYPDHSAFLLTGSNRSTPWTAWQLSHRGATLQAVISVLTLDSEYDFGVYSMENLMF